MIGLEENSLRTLLNLATSLAEAPAKTSSTAVSPLDCHLVSTCQTPLQSSGSSPLWPFFNHWSRMVPFHFSQGTFGRVCHVFYHDIVTYVPWRDDQRNGLAGRMERM